MALCVPGVEVQDKALAVRLGDVDLWVGRRRLSKQFLPPPPPLKPIRIVDYVPDFVAENTHAPRTGPAFHLEHLAQLEPGESRMGEIERNCDSGDAVGCEPVV